MLTVDQKGVGTGAKWGEVIRWRGFRFFSFLPQLVDRSKTDFWKNLWFRLQIQKKSSQDVCWNFLHFPQNTELQFFAKKRLCSPFELKEGKMTRRWGKLFQTIIILFICSSQYLFCHYQAEWEEKKCTVKKNGCGTLSLSAGVQRVKNCH